MFAYLSVIVHLPREGTRNQLGKHLQRLQSEVFVRPRFHGTVCTCAYWSAQCKPETPRLLTGGAWS